MPISATFTKSVSNFGRQYNFPKFFVTVCFQTVFTPPIADAANVLLLRLKLFLAMAFAIVAKQKSFPKAIQRIAGNAECCALLLSIGVKFV